MVVVVVTTTAISLFMLQNLTRLNPDLQAAVDQEPLEFDVFVKKYLPTGEVRYERIVHDHFIEIRKLNNFIKKSDLKYSCFRSRS